MENLEHHIEEHINKIMGRGILEDVVIDCIIVAEEANNNLNKEGLILEKKNVFTPIAGLKNYTYRIDQQQGSGGPGRQRHIHLFYNGKELFAINADGTAHDGYHQVLIPQEVVPFLKSKKINVPLNNLIEFYQPSGETMICEKKDNIVTKLALELGDIVRRSNQITIIESNLDVSDLRFHSKVDYQNVKKLENTSQNDIGIIKDMIVKFLKKSGKYIGDDLEIFDDKLYSTPHSLFVAWD